MGSFLRLLLNGIENVRGYFSVFVKEVGKMSGSSYKYKSLVSLLDLAVFILDTRCLFCMCACG